MNRTFSIVLFFLAIAGVSLWARDRQSQAPAAASPVGSSDLTATGVAPGDVVISIQGFCDQGLLVEGSIHASGGNPRNTDNSSPDGTDASSAPSNNDKWTSDCRAEVTRAQFEQLVDALEPKMRRSDRIRVAVRYAEALVFAERAKDTGLDRDPKVQEAAKYSHLQFLSMAFNKHLQAQATEVSDAEVKTYYEEHPELFVQAHFLQVFVPEERKHSDVPSTPQKVEERRLADKAAMKSLATRVRASAVAGASFEKLEKEVYEFAGQSKDDVPDVDLGEVNRTQAPPELQQVFDLKAGQVSEVVSGPKGWHIVKVVSRKQIPLSEAKGILQSIRILEATNAAKNSAKTEFNDAYFNTQRGMEPATVEQKGQK